MNIDRLQFILMDFNEDKDTDACIESIHDLYIEQIEQWVKMHKKALNTGSIDSGAVKVILDALVNFVIKK